MADRLNAKRVGYSLAAVSGIVYLACAILVAIAPSWTVSFFGALFHGIDISKITRESVPFTSTVLGLIEIIALSLIVGYIFAKIYNRIKE